jgi:pimeloyl-ACP methyl ester carboxylesterase
VLVIRGEDTYVLFDRVINPLVSQLLRGESFTMSGTGHLVPLEAPEKTAQVVMRFLKKHIT